MAQRSVLFKVLGVAAGVVFAGYGMVERFSISRVKRTGESAIVQPVQTYTTHKQRGLTTYTADFNFKTASGTPIRVKKSFPEEVLKDFQAKRPVKVFYNPRNPSEFVFEKEQPSWFLIGLGVGIAVVAIIFA